MISSQLSSHVCTSGQLSGPACNKSEGSITASRLHVVASAGCRHMACHGRMLCLFARSSCFAPLSPSSHHEPVLPIHVPDFTSNTASFTMQPCNWLLITNTDFFNQSVTLRCWVQAGAMGHHHASASLEGGLVACTQQSVWRTSCGRVTRSPR